MTDFTDIPTENSAIEQHTPAEIFSVEHRPGDTVFAMVCVCVCLFLLSQIGEQTKWINNTKLFVQPRFWPGLSLAGFLFFSVGYLLISFRRHLKTDGAQLVPYQELLHWCRPLEYALYFIGYVYLVPRLGYLPATLLVFPALTVRAGYRTLKYILLSLVAGIATVVIFKAFLQVRIPGGQLYEWFPEQIRNFMIVYL